jgi:hypothetical protein
MDVSLHPILQRKVKGRREKLGGKRRSLGKAELEEVAERVQVRRSESKGD